MKKIYSFAEYAAHRGVSRMAVTLAVKSGKISTIKVKGKLRIDPDVADKEWKDNTMAGQADPILKKDREPTEHETTYAKSRSIREAYNARLARLNYEEKLGNLISADKVKIAAFNTARATRDALLAIPDRVSPEIAAKKDVREINLFLSKAIIEALENLSGEFFTDGDS